MRVLVAVPRVNVQHAPDAPAEARRDTILIQVQPTDGLIGEYAEQPGGVVEVVDGHAIEQHQVMPRLAAAHEDAPQAVGPGLHAGEETGHPQRVGLPAGPADAPHFLPADAGARIPQIHVRVLLARAGADDDGGELPIGPQGNIDEGIGAEDELHFHRLVADVAGAQQVAAAGEGQGVEAIFVRQRPHFFVHHLHRRAEKSLTALPVGDDAVDVEGLGTEVGVDVNEVAGRGGLEGEFGIAQQELQPVREGAFAAGDADDLLGNLVGPVGEFRAGLCELQQRLFDRHGAPGQVEALAVGLGEKDGPPPYEADQEKRPHGQ